MNRFRYSLALLFVLFFHSLGEKNANASKENSDSIARAKFLITELRTVADIPGMAVAVGNKDRILWEEGFGLSDLENRVAVSTDTKFRLGSVSKILTIAAAARLMEQGVLDINAPLSKYLSDLPDSYGKITVRQLAGHLGGVRHYKPEDFQHDLKHYDSVRETLAIFKTDPLLQEPGAKYEYSTFGYVLISAVMEAAAGTEFLKILEREVLQPLRMKHSCLDLVSQIIPNKTRYYSRKQGKLINAAYEDPSYKWAAAGILSTAGDLVRFGQAHLTPGFLREQTLKELFTSQRSSDGKETKVGLGWRIGSDWKDRRIYHHAGNISGGRAVLVIYPDHDLVISLVTNISSQPAFVESTAQMIAENFFTQKDPTVVQQNLSGTYQLQGTAQEKSYVAAINLSQKNGVYEGVLSGNFPLIETAEKNGLPGAIRIAGVFMKDKNPALVLVSAFGLLELQMEKMDNDYLYSIDEGPAKFTGMMRKSSS